MMTNHPEKSELTAEQSPDELLSEWLDRSAERFAERVLGLVDRDISTADEYAGVEAALHLMLSKIEMLEGKRDRRGLNELEFARVHMDDRGSLYREEEIRKHRGRTVSPEGRQKVYERAEAVGRNVAIMELGMLHWYDAPGHKEELTDMMHRHTEQVVELQIAESKATTTV